MLTGVIHGGAGSGASKRGVAGQLGYPALRNFLRKHITGNASGMRWLSANANPTVPTLKTDDRAADYSLEAQCPDASKRFDAKALGALANGVANDRAAIQDALDLASAVGGCAVLSVGIFKSGGLLPRWCPTVHSTPHKDWINTRETVRSDCVTLAGSAGQTVSRAVQNTVFAWILLYPG